MRIHRALIALELIASGPVDELEAGVHTTRRRGQGQEQPPFCWRQIDRGVIDEHLSSGLVDDEAPLPERDSITLGDVSRPRRKIAWTRNTNSRGLNGFVM